MKKLTSVLITILCLAACCLAQTAYDFSRLKMEPLGRGVIAVRKSPSEVFVSWRYLSSDPAGAAFDIYRNGVKVNGKAIKDVCWFVDSNSSLASATYEVRPRSGGLRGGAFTLPARAPQGYIPIALDTPADQTMPDGEIASYTPNDCSIGDVDGDGEYEIFLKWDPSNAHDNAHNGYTGDVFIDCLKLDGTRLWRVNLGRNIRAGAHYTQMMVYDLNGDGCAEMVVKTADGTIDGTGKVIGDPTADYREHSEATLGRIMSGPEYLTVFNGRTGAAMKTVDYVPGRGENGSWGDTRANRSDRYLAGIAYLDGEHPSVVMCRGYYTRATLAAYDWDGKDLKLRWLFDSHSSPELKGYDGQGNHNLRVADVDGDGCDEIVYGSCCIDHDGTGLYTTGWGHGDAMHIGAMVPGSDALQIWIGHETKGVGTTLTDARTGKLHFRIPSNIDVGRTMAADIDPTNPGWELWSAASGTLRDYRGGSIGEKPASQNFAIWWDGDLSRELLDGNKVLKFNPQTRKVEDCFVFEGASSINGTKSNPCISGDLFGDWREEALMRSADNKELRLYVSTEPTSYRFHTFLEDPVYRTSLANENVCYNQPPETGFYFGSDLNGKFRGATVRGHKVKKGVLPEDALLDSVVIKSTPRQQGRPPQGPAPRGQRTPMKPEVQQKRSVQQPTAWYTPTVENKPFVRWWWLGSAVDEEGLTWNLEQFAKAGIGGYEVTPIYGVQGNEENDIDYLSPEWMKMYKHLVSESERLGLECDLNNGTGWPFGGPQITEELAAKKMKITPEGISTELTGQKVKRAAPGGEGLVMDHYNPEALKVYLGRFEKAFKESGAKWPHTWFNDSYEVYGADWTEKFPEIFKERYGYDIEPYLRMRPEPQGRGRDAKPAASPSRKASSKLTDYDRAIADYRECLGSLLIENFITPWIEWCHSHGSLVRNQSHGSPANLLDVYAAVDIPECETYGRSDFNIPGLRQDPIRRPNDGDPAVLKFASSAAHLAGRKYVSCESLTWLTEHFRTSLSQCKPELDQAFAAGVNHIYFHGAPYSPKGAEFPGWMFYASVNMSPTGAMWRDAPALFKYVERCQAFLTAGSPDSDFLLYFPVYDAWSSMTDTPYMMFDIHSMGRKLPEFKAVMNEISFRGYDADYISDKQLQTLKIDKPVIVPACKLMPVETARRLVELKKKGVPVYFIDNVPEDVPGLHDLAARRREFRSIARGFGKAVSLDKAFAGMIPEEFRSVFGGSMIRRRNECGGWNYFAAMLTGKGVDGWVKLGTPAVSAMLYDAVSGVSGKAQVRNTSDGCAEIRLQLKPGESVLIKTFPTQVEAPAWNYIASEGAPIAIDRAWNISFPQSAPQIKGNFFTDKPMDWTKLKNCPDAKINFATALYSSAIPMTDPKAADSWILDLEDVRESARVFINGEEVGTAWCAPFRIDIGKFLKPGINLLDVYVTNLQSNRIADYDRRGVKWRIFKDANISTLGHEKDFGKWETDPSGLCSGVNLIPVHYDIPSREAVTAQARKVNSYFMRKYGDPAKVVPFPSRHKVYEGNIWTRAVYYEGLLALYGVDPQQEYLDYTMDWGERFGWNMRGGNFLTRNADNYCCAQAYIDMYRIYKDPKMMENVVKCMDNLISTDESDADWTWIDAIQMGMPVLVKYGVTAGKPEYFEKAWKMYKWARDRFFNEGDGLWWRDKDFCPPYKTPSGKNCYWSRGNGWVLAAYVRVLDELPASDPHRAVYEADFKAMCEALIKVQREDGTWNCSLADPEDFGGPEATGTSLFTYGLAWGVRTGRLDEATFRPAAVRGWNALNRICVHNNGFIGYSQGSGKEPKEAQPATWDRIPDFEDFGTGCYLLAASEIAKL